MQRLEVSGVVRTTTIVVVRRQRVKVIFSCILSVFLLCSSLTSSGRKAPRCLFFLGGGGL